MKYGNRPLWQRIVRSPLMMIVAIVLFVILAKAAWNIHEKAALSGARLEQAHNELLKLQARQQDLSGKVAFLSTDQGVESELRTKYLAVKDDESVAVITDPDVSTTSTITPVVMQEGWFTRFLHALGL